MSKKIKTIATLKKELKKDIKDMYKSIEENIEIKDYTEVIHDQHSLWTMEYILDLIDGRL